MSKPYEKMGAEHRKAYILKNGAALAEIIGLTNVTPKLISHHCEINTSFRTIIHYYNNHKELHEAIANSEYASESVKSAYFDIR